MNRDVQASPAGQTSLPWTERTERLWVSHLKWLHWLDPMIKSGCAFIAGWFGPRALPRDQASTPPLLLVTTTKPMSSFLFAGAFQFIPIIGLSQLSGSASVARTCLVDPRHLGTVEEPQTHENRSAPATEVVRSSGNRRRFALEIGSRFVIMVRAHRHKISAWLTALMTDNGTEGETRR